MNKKHFEPDLELKQVFEKYKNYEVEKLKNVLEYYFGKIEFLRDTEKEDNLPRDYFPIGVFQIGKSHKFYVQILDNQCGLRAMDRYFNCLGVNFFLGGGNFSDKGGYKLNVVLFICILKILYEIKPDILYLLSDIENSFACGILNLFNPPVYKSTNPNTGNLINYYILNAKTSNLL